MSCFWLNIMLAITSYPVLIASKGFSLRHNNFNVEQRSANQERNHSQGILDGLEQYPWCPSAVNPKIKTRNNLGSFDPSPSYPYCISSRNLIGKCLSYREYLNCIDSYIHGIIMNNNCKCQIEPNRIGFCCEDKEIHTHNPNMKISELQDAEPICGLEQSPTTRITNGNLADPHQVPWLVAIFRQSYTMAIVDYVCGGSLISASFVLTAAHCVQLVNNQGFIQHSYKPDDFYVRLGDYNVMSSHDDKFRKVMDLTVVSIVSHPSFNTPFKYDNDIALIRLNESVNYYQTQFIKPLCVIGVNSHEITTMNNFFTVMVAGRGKSKTGEDSHTPQFVNLHVLPNGLCQYFFLQPIGEQHMCVGDLLLRGQDACAGDSGGPVMIKDPKTNRMILVGIVSFGRECGRLYPAVYTNVLHYVEWIIGEMNTVIHAQGPMPVGDGGNQKNDVKQLL